jgi:hypothetical protein
LLEVNGTEQGRKIISVWTVDFFEGILCCSAYHIDADSCLLQIKTHCCIAITVEIIQYMQFEISFFCILLHIYDIEKLP